MSRPSGMKRFLVAGVLALVPILAGGCGGSHRCSLVLRAVPTNGQKVTPAGMQLAQQIATNRLDKIGVSSPKVTVHGDELVIELAGGVHDPAVVAKIVGTTGNLQMFDFEPNLEPPTVSLNRQPAPLPSLYALLTAVQKRANDGSPQSYYLFKTAPSHRVLQGPAPTVKQLLLPTKDGHQPPRTEVLKVPAGTEPVWCSGARNCLGAGSNGSSRDGRYWYLLRLPPALTGTDLVESGIAAVTDTGTGRPIVTLQFTRHGLKEFKKITEAEYNRGRVNASQNGRLHSNDAAAINHYAGHNALVLDGHLVETPYIDYTDPTLSQGIIGNAEITEPSIKAATRTALVLQSGSLPYRFQPVGLTGCSR